MQHTENAMSKVRRFEKTVDNCKPRAAEEGSQGLHSGQGKDFLGLPEIGQVSELRYYPSFSGT